MTRTPSPRVGGVGVTLSEVQTLFLLSHLLPPSPYIPPLPPSWAGPPSASPLGDADGGAVSDHLVITNPNSPFNQENNPIPKDSTDSFISRSYKNHVSYLYFPLIVVSICRVRPILLPSMSAVTRSSPPSPPDSLASPKALAPALQAQTSLLKEKEKQLEFNQPTTRLATKWPINSHDSTVLIPVYCFIIPSIRIPVIITNCMSIMVCQSFYVFHVTNNLSMCHSESRIHPEYITRTLVLNYSYTRIRSSHSLISLSVIIYGRNSMVHSNTAMTRPWLAHSLPKIWSLAIVWRCLKHCLWVSVASGMSLQVISGTKLLLRSRRAG